MNSGNETVVLSEQDEQVLMHLARYRLTLTRIVQAEIYPERTMKKAWGRLYTLEKAGYLAKHELPSRGKYWTLGKLGITHAGATRDWHKPLAAQSFRKWLTTLLFCLDGKTKRSRLTAYEMEQLPLEGCYKKQLFESRNYFVQRDDDMDRLGCIRPAADTDPYLVARKCRGDFSLHAKHKGFADLIATRRFLIAVVAANKLQVKPLQKAIHAHLGASDDAEFPVRVYVREGLGKLLAMGRVAES